MSNDLEFWTDADKPLMPDSATIRLFVRRGNEYGLVTATSHIKRNVHWYEYPPTEGSRYGRTTICHDWGEAFPGP